MYETDIVCQIKWWLHNICNVTVHCVFTSVWHQYSVQMRRGAVLDDLQGIVLLLYAMYTVFNFAENIFLINVSQ